MDLENTVQAQIVKADRKRTSSNRGFWIAVTVSLLVHTGGAAAAFYVRPQRPTIDLNRAIPVQLVKLGKKRDPNLLPRKVAPPPPPPKDEGIAIQKDDAPKPKKDKTPKSREEADKRSLLDQRLDRALDKLPPEEAEGDPMGSEFGTTTDATNAAAGYILEIGKVLQANYRLPEAIPASQRAFLKARVVLFIERNGVIAQYEFVEAHPNQLFMSALESLLKSVKLPPPPQEQADTFREVGIELVFRP